MNFNPNASYFIGPYLPQYDDDVCPGCHPPPPRRFCRYGIYAVPVGTEINYGYVKYGCSSSGNWVVIPKQ